MHQGDTFPAWVEHELHNWARWQWDGELPHPLPHSGCASAERRYLPPGRGDDDAEPVRAAPICIERAERVHAIYRRLPLVEQRVMQAEYTRRHEYDEYDYRGEWLRNSRAMRAPKGLGITREVYRIVLDRIKRQVMEECKA